jgi:peptidoglycan/xylan/chitin deacetylase (PgdA/CDA1 family)
VRVLHYHGVSAGHESNSHFSFLLEDWADFEDQIRRLAKRCRPVSLGEIDASLSGGDRLPESAVHVSFDDGYRNSLVAAEILDRHRVPWSLFIVFDSVLDGYRPWYLRLVDAIDASTNVMLANGSVFEIGDVRSKRRIAQMAKVEVMASSDGDEDAAVDRLLARPGMRTPDQPGWPKRGLTEVRQLASAGVEIGNHSARHRNLPRCSDRDLHREVTVAGVRLEEALAIPVRYFAYPDGRHTRRGRAEVARRHALGLATWTMRTAAAPYAVRRYGPVGAGDLDRILRCPEPWYGQRWLRSNLPWRAREATRRLRSVVAR